MKSLLRAVVKGDDFVLRSIRDLLTDDGSLTVTIGIDPMRDRSELNRYGISRIDLEYLNSTLAARYSEAGFKMVECRKLAVEEWSRLETSWARKLGGNHDRQVFRMKYFPAKADGA